MWRLQSRGHCFAGIFTCGTIVTLCHPLPFSYSRIGYCLSLFPTSCFRLSLNISLMSSHPLYLLIYSSFFLIPFLLLLSFLLRLYLPPLSPSTSQYLSSFISSPSPTLSLYLSLYLSHPPPLLHSPFLSCSLCVVLPPIPQQHVSLLKKEWEERGKERGPGDQPSSPPARTREPGPSPRPAINYTYLLAVEN